MHQDIALLKKQRHRKFMKKGITFAVASGICYGLYTAFLTLAETQGVWGAWFASEPWGGAPLSAFTVTFALAALAAGLNDLFSGLWSLVACAKNGQLGDLWKTVKTKPGRVMMLCAAIGGPFATIAYVVALNSATAAGNPGVIVPIAALNCAIGTVLGRILFKQKLEAHKVLGVLICLVAAGSSAEPASRTWAPRRCSAACSRSLPLSDGASRAAWPASAPSSSTTALALG